jgi:hypothetical protein
MLIRYIYNIILLSNEGNWPWECRIFRNSIYTCISDGVAARRRKKKKKKEKERENQLQCCDLQAVRRPPLNFSENTGLVPSLCL